MQFTGYDFFDFGTGKGYCYEFARKKMKLKKGLGFDLNPHKVKNLNKIGIPCLLQDVTALDLPRKCVRVVTMGHFLEHLKSTDMVYSVLSKALQTADEYIYIEGPCFDFDKFLESHNLRFYWSNWVGHPTHVTSTLLISMLNDLGISQYSLVRYGPVNSSQAACIHPWESPKDQFNYDSNVHSSKVDVKFSYPLYTGMYLFVWLKDRKNKKDLISLRKKNIRRVYNG